jgi:FAD-linked sulfhydryl oxidase
LVHLLIFAPSPHIYLLHGYLRLCFIHNKVNERLRKPEFDCANLDATYDCGCGDSMGTAGTTQQDRDEPRRDMPKDAITGAGLIKGGR